jgi:small-conductance mechanosensitive channel
MKMKSIITVLMAAIFLLSLASFSLAAGAEKMGVKGTITKIEGNKVTVQNDMGKETTVDVKDVKDTMVGDKVKIENGVIKKSADEPETSGKPKKPGY